MFFQRSNHLIPKLCMLLQNLEPFLTLNKYDKLKYDGLNRLSLRRDKIVRLSGK